MLILLTDTVFGSGKTPDYLLLGNMVYTVSVVLLCGASGHFCVLMFIVLRPSRPYEASVIPAPVLSAVLTVLLRYEVLRGLIFPVLLYGSEQIPFLCPVVNNVLFFIDFYSFKN